MLFERTEKLDVELIALLLLAPLLWSNDSTSSPVETSSSVAAVLSEASSDASNDVPRVELVDGRWLVHPPADTSLTMTVLEHRVDQAAASRSPASVDTASRRIDVIVSAP